MDKDTGTKKNGRVTTREFYQALLDLTDKIGAFRDELVGQNRKILEKVEAVERQVNTRIDCLDVKLEEHLGDSRIKTDKLDIVAELAKANSDAIQEISSRIE